jgi:long-chain-alcohol oxidase
VGAGSQPCIPEESKEVEEEEELEADVVVVGSGSGGGVFVHELLRARPGLRVVLLEKGGLYRQADFARWREAEAMDRAFERFGLMGSEDGAVVVLAGACDGGGSTINWSASFRTPEHVLKDWEVLGLPQFR